MVRAITRVSELVGSNPAAVASLSASTDNARPLFDLVREARRASEAADQIAVTIYDQAIVARAWAGAPSDIPNERISAPSTLFVTPSPLGPAPRALAADRQRRRGAVRRRGHRARPVSGAGSDDTHADRLHARNRSRARVSANAVRRRRRSVAIGRGGAACALGRTARRGVGRSGRARGGACTLAPDLFRHGHRRGRRHGAALHRAAARPAHRGDRTPLPDFHGGRVRARLRRRIALVDGVRRRRAWLVSDAGDAPHHRRPPPRPWSASWPAPPRACAARDATIRCRERRQASG